MDLHPIPTDNVDIEEIQRRYNEVASGIWDIAEELEIEAVTLTEAILYIERTFDDEAL